jgi:hypothetical protein
MNLDYLRKLSQEGQSKIANDVLKLCNPKEIAQKLKANLEENAQLQASKGRREGVARYTLWMISTGGPDGPYRGEGPLANYPNREEAAKLICPEIKKHLSDDNLILEIEMENEDRGNWNFFQQGDIKASVSW